MSKVKERKKRTESVPQPDPVEQIAAEPMGQVEQVEAAAPIEPEVVAEVADEPPAIVAEDPPLDYSEPALPDNDVEVSTGSIIEAILMATDAPLPAPKIAEILGTGNASDVKEQIAQLNEQYAATGRSFRIEEIAKGFQILTVPVYNGWLKKVLSARADTKLTGAALETLAIIAYKQPVLRAEIEAIRGVAAGDIVNRLREMNMVKIVGRAEEIGRPMLYGTTKRFLEVFGLAGLEDLPKVEELVPPPAK
jgi:segregation and condensation protein B